MTRTMNKRSKSHSQTRCQRSSCLTQRVCFLTRASSCSLIRISATLARREKQRTSSFQKTEDATSSPCSPRALSDASLSMLLYEQLRRSSASDVKRLLQTAHGNARSVPAYDLFKPFSTSASQNVSASSYARSVLSWMKKLHRELGCRHTPRLFRNRMIDPSCP